MAVASGATFLQSADCFFARNIREVELTAGCKRGHNRRLERVYLKNGVFLEGPKLSSYLGPLPGDSRNTCCSTSAIKRNMTLDVRCQGEKVKVRLRLHHRIPYGEHHALLGSTESAGSWKNRVMMGWTEDGWVVDLEMDPGEKLEYKYIIITWNGHVVWEHGANRVLVVPNDPRNHYEVNSHWSATHEMKDFEIISQTPTRDAEAMAADHEVQLEENASGSFALEEGYANGSITLQEVNANGSVALKEENSKGSINLEEENAKGAVALEEENERGSVTVEGKDSPDIGSSFVQEWQGEEISSMKTNEREGKWDTTGLDKPAKHIVEGDQKSANWWRKVSIFVLLVIIWMLSGPLLPELWAKLKGWSL